MTEKEKLQELKEIKTKAKQRWSKKKYKKWGTKDKFVDWFIGKYIKQGGKCFYCGHSGKVSEHYEEQLKEIGMWRRYKGFRKGKRGKSLEVDRKESAKGYVPNNCVLVCYPCNNAKSDVFSRKKFMIIGAVIGRLMNKENKEKLIKMKNNKFFQGLVNDVEKQKKLRKSKLIMTLKKLQENIPN